MNTKASPLLLAALWLARPIFPMKSTMTFLGVATLAAVHAFAQPYAIDWHTTDGGGGTSTGDGYSLRGTIGQPDAGAPMTGGDFSLTGGFWSLNAEETPSEPIMLFDNSSGSSNGQRAASTVSWMAGKFCPGSQAYSLDSVTLFLNSGDFSGRPHESTVRLQIYSHNPATGRPSTNTGPVMNLSGTTNPITLAAGNVSTPFTWIPATPFTLSANECYWAVLSVESGRIAYQWSTSIIPIGAAGTLGRSYTENAGVSWVPTDGTSNWRMQIMGTPSAPPPQLAIVRSGGSAILSWPANAAGFTLQSTTNLVPPAVWSTVSPAAVVVQGNYTVTNAVSGSQKFYRLRE